MTRAELGKFPSRAPPSHLNLPPGFRFFPTDEELVLDYLCKKAPVSPTSRQEPHIKQNACMPTIIADVELYKFDPWDLPGKHLMFQHTFHPLSFFNFN